MNDRRKYYYPLLVYGAILLLVWVFSFFADVARLLSDSAGQATSLVSGEGIRWAVRSALPILNSVPWGTSILLMATLGLLQGSGLLAIVGRLSCMRRLTVSEWHAFSFSLAATLCYLVLLYMTSVSPWSLLRGVTGEQALSPVSQGWAILTFLGVLAASLVYGFIYGNYRSLMDVAVSVGNTFTQFVPALFALLPASGIVPCLRYIKVVELTPHTWEVVAMAIYLLPFIYVAVLRIVDSYRK